MYAGDCPRTDLTSLALYADDTCIYAAAHHPDSVATYIQHHIDLLEDWCIKWKVKINAEKSHAVYFSWRSTPPPRIYIFDTVLEWENSARYLGVTLDKRLTWKTHVENVVNSMNKKIAQLRLLFFGAHLSRKNKILLYRTVVLPSALYAAPIWTYAAKTHLEKIERCQNRLLRRIRKAHRYLRNTIVRKDLHILSYRQYASQASANFYDRIYDTPNEIIAELPDYDHTEECNRKRPRASMLPDR